MSSRAERSLETGLQLWMGLLLFLLLLGLLGLSLWVGRETALQFVSTRLAHDAESILANLRPTERAFARPLSSIYQQPFSGHYLSIRFDDGSRLRSRSLWDETLRDEPLSTGETRQQQYRGPRSQHLLSWSAGYEKAGQRFTLTVAEDISPLLARFEKLLWMGLALVLAGATLLLLAQKLLLRRMFQQLDTLRLQLRDIVGGQRSELDTAVPGEIQPLVAEFNQLLKSLQAHLQRARHAAGNLAHGLKGPLHLLLQQGQRLNDATVLEQSEQMRHLIERELHRARLAGSALAGRHFHPARDIADLVDTLQALYPDRPLHFEHRVEAPETLPLDQDDMMELIGNLLDNASKWARTAVYLRLSLEDGDFLLGIEDDGPGMPVEERERVRLRGQRLDERRDGHGLGLAIAADIVQGYGGSLVLEDSERLGGLRVVVQIPGLDT